MSAAPLSFAFSRPFPPPRPSPPRPPPSHAVVTPKRSARFFLRASSSGSTGATATLPKRSARFAIFAFSSSDTPPPPLPPSLALERGRPNRSARAFFASSMDFGAATTGMPKRAARAVLAASKASAVVGATAAAASAGAAAPHR
eukprot:CAMPEP_0185432282 /NCGR_PEP_ID=MMETSP1365-20130426/18658_1 /TAXON_ID=38817 /ORGANISM="Gephyrocapsa oceanica, Strain RCC1303" /LENGTH=143 /DNA_ID=CAMNT_0028036647 /DNA_START=57 /DNA_END=484 /DNA_ORIENTATION=-